MSEFGNLEMRRRMSFARQSAISLQLTAGTEQLQLRTMDHGRWTMAWRRRARADNVRMIEGSNDRTGAGCAARSCQSAACSCQQVGALRAVHGRRSTVHGGRRWGLRAMRKDRRNKFKDRTGAGRRCARGRRARRSALEGGVMCWVRMLGVRAVNVSAMKRVPQGMFS